MFKILIHFHIESTSHKKNVIVEGASAHLLCYPRYVGILYGGYIVVPGLGRDCLEEGGYKKDVVDVVVVNIV